MNANGIDPVQYVPMIYHLLNRMPAARRAGIDVPAVFAAGECELVRCAKKWKRGGAASFLTYAMKCVKGALFRAIRQEINWRAMAASNSMLRQRVRLFLFSERGPHYVRGRAPEFARPDPAIGDMEKAEAVTWLLGDALETLSPRVRMIIRLRNGLGDEPPLSLDAVSRRLYVSRARVRQLEAKGIWLLRERLGVSGKRAFIDEMAEELRLPRGK